MYDRFDYNHNAHDLVDFDEVVDGQNGRATFCAQPCEVFAQDERQYECTVEVQAISLII